MTSAVRFTDDVRDVHVDVALPEGRVLGVVGPNGAGKSTLLSVLAGTLRPGHGRVVVGDRVLLDTDAGTWVPPHARGVGLLAQEPLLLPHLSALDNVAFGPRSLGASRTASRTTARERLDDVGLLDLADRRPSALSGGQAARVALARALAPEPRLLLLDEPMAALDVTVVPTMRAVLRRALAGRSAVLVTHDVLDALLLTDELLVLEGGRVADHGPTRRVLSAPRSDFGAGLAGLNLLRGTARTPGLVTEDGLAVHADGATDLPEGSPAVAVVDPAAVAVHLDAPAGSPRNVWPATVVTVEPHGRRARVRTDVADADVSAEAVVDLDLVPGRRVHLVVKAGEVALHPA